jgi:hypothetical protein
MATAYKVLGQSNPAATTLTTLYTVPAATEAVVSTITVANIGASTLTFRIAIRVAGAAITAKQYIAYDAELSPNTAHTMTLGLTLAATDVISVYASSTDAAFSAFGSEIS